MVNPNGKKIALIGAMGSGKSTCARKYAEYFGVSYFDTDDYISRRYGEISGIFEREGEKTFREYERIAIKEAVASDAFVIACGGGVVLDKRNIKELRRSCDIVWIKASTQTLKKRIAESDRPLKADIERIAAERQPLYERYADYVLINEDGDPVDPPELIRAVIGTRRNRYDVVLCDADDTLLDSKAATRSCIIRTARSFGISLPDETVVNAYFRCNGKIWAELERGEITRAELDRKRFEVFRAEIGMEFDPREMNEFYINEMKKTRNVIDGAIPFLRKLKKRGIKVYIITNSFTRIAKERLKAVDGEVDGCFISEEVGYNKPDRRFFEKVLERIGSPDVERVLVVGDSNTSDIAGGIGIGADTCLFDPSRAVETAADYVAATYSQILDIV